VDLGVGAGFGSGGVGRGEWGDEDDVRNVEALRACRTSVGEGIRVLRYLASGVISWVDREQKCRRKANEASMPKLWDIFQDYDDTVRIRTHELYHPLLKHSRAA
jgi:hypothetical protein